MRAILLISIFATPKASTKPSVISTSLTIIEIAPGTPRGKSKWVRISSCRINLMNLEIANEIHRVRKNAKMLPIDMTTDPNSHSRVNTPRNQSYMVSYIKYPFRVR